MKTPLQVGETYANWKILAVEPMRTASGGIRYRVQCPNCEIQSVKTKHHMERAGRCAKCRDKHFPFNGFKGSLRRS